MISAIFGDGEVLGEEAAAAAAFVESLKMNAKLR
jgi:hypothetical protein